MTEFSTIEFEVSNENQYNYGNIPHEETRSRRKPELSNNKRAFDIDRNIDMPFTHFCNIMFS